MKLESNKSVIQITNRNDHSYLINPRAVLANFNVLTLNQPKHVKPMPLQTTQFIQPIPRRSTTSDRKLFPEPIWSDDEERYPSLETCTDRDTLNPLQRPMYYQIVKLRTQEKLDPKASDEQRQTFLSRFNRDN